MRFEICNPSDHCEMEHESHEACAVACTLLGNGAYGLKGIDTELGCPVFLLGGHDEWFLETFGAKFSDCLERSQQAAAEALRSVRLRSERTSLTDICKTAHDWANALDANRKRRAP